MIRTVTPAFANRSRVSVASGRRMSRRLIRPSGRTPCGSSGSRSPSRRPARRATAQHEHAPALGRPRHLPARRTAPRSPCPRPCRGTTLAPERRSTRRWRTAPGGLRRRADAAPACRTDENGTSAMTVLRVARVSRASRLGSSGSASSCSRPPIRWRRLNPVVVARRGKTSSASNSPAVIVPGLVQAQRVDVAQRLDRVGLLDQRAERARSASRRARTRSRSTRTGRWARGPRASSPGPPPGRARPTRSSPRG